MAHPLVDQFLFTQQEFLRGLNGLSEEDAQKHLGPMNCISWVAGHLAWQEQRYFLERAQDLSPYPHLNELYAYPAPMCTPPLAEMLELMSGVVRAAQPYLDALTTQGLLADLPRRGKSIGQSVGSALRRTTYHYWYHTGEVQAIRQMLGHTGLAEYVGDLEQNAPYRPEEND